MRLFPVTCCSGTDNCRAFGSNEAQAILSKENCNLPRSAIFGSNQTAAEGVLAANANLNVLGSDAANGDVIGVGFDAGSIIKAAVQDGTFLCSCLQLTGSKTVSSDDGLLCNLRSDSSS